MADETTSLPIIRTKLHRPPAPGDHVHRPRLLERLEQRRYRPLTLVSAPAGYGKSTLVGCWLDRCNSPGGWLSLDEHDNDLRLFLTYFVAAVQDMFPDAVSETMSLVSARTLPPVSVLAGSLANELDLIGEDFILVLDDIHRIQEDSVHELLTELLRHPPRPMHLVLVGRRDPSLPITVLRARDQVTEVRLFDLRFTTVETAEFLQRALGEGVDEARAAALAERAEGWVTGLRLAVLAMRGHDDAVSKLLELKGTTAYVMDYLITEVLDAQSPVMRHYLLSTSILDRFCAPLCEVLCGPAVEPGEDEMDGQGFVASVQQNNLFVIPLDTENRWFRYHHLIQDLLQSQMKRRCSSGEIATLQSRASEWFAENGLIDESIQHALAAGDVIGAAQLVEQNRQAMLNSDRWYILERWLSVFPDTAIQQRPELLLAQVWVHYFHYRFALIPPIVDVVESLLSNEPKDQPLYGEIYLFKGVLCFWQGNGSLSLKYIKDALDRIPTAHHMIRGFAEIYFGLAGQMQGQKERVVHVLSDLLNDQSLKLPRKIRALVSLVWIHIISGDLVEASTLNEELRDVAIKYNSAAFITWTSYNQGLIHFCRNELEAAIHYFSQAAEKTSYLMLRRASVDCMAGLTLAYQAMQEPNKATAELERLFEYIRPFNDPALLDIAHSCRARLSLMKGEAPFALGVRSINGTSNAEPMVLWLEVPVIIQCRLLLAQGTNASLQEVEKKLQEYLQLNQAQHNSFQLIGILSLQAITFDRTFRDVIKADLI